MKYIRGFGILALFLLIAGCAAAPVQQEVDLPAQVLGEATAGDGNALVVFYNDSNSLMYGIDGSGKINVSIDGKGVGQLSIGKYLVLETAAGEHNVTLMHKDIFDFTSEHSLDLTSNLAFVRIFAKVTSNGLEVTSKPDNFETEYEPAY